MDSENIWTKGTLDTTRGSLGDTFPLETTKIQRIVGSFLYYARALDNTIQTTVNKLSVSQASPQGLHVYPSTRKK